MNDIHPASPAGGRQPGAALAASVTGYGPDADALRAEVDRDEARFAATPGQAFYAAYSAAHPYGSFGPWDDLDDGNQRAIEAGAQAAIDAGTGKILAELASWRRTAEKITAERDELIAGYVDTADRDEYQLVIREMLDWYWQPGGVDDERRAAWRKRGGLEPS